MRVLAIKFGIAVVMSFASRYIFCQHQLFVGNYTNMFTGLTISINEDYSGTYSLLDQNYAVTAELINDNHLSCSYEYEGEEATFLILLDGTRYFIKSEGIKLKLRYEGKNNLASKADTTIKNSAKLSSNSKRLNVQLNKEFLSYPNKGYQFKAPIGWSYQLIENGVHYYQSIDKISSIVILEHAYSDRKQVKAVAESEGIQEENTILFTSEPIKDFGTNGILGTFSGWIEGVNSKAAIVSLFSPHGGGITVMVYSHKKDFNLSYVEIAKKIANAVKFSKPIVSELVTQWENKLINKKIVYYNTGSNSTEKTSYTLYTNKQFLYYSSSSYASSDTYNDYSSASSSDASGTWKIKEDKTGIYIEFQYSNGNVSSQYLTMKEKSNTQIFLNGTRYFIKGIND